MEEVTVYVAIGKHWRKKHVKIGATQCLEKRLRSLFNKEDKFKLIHAVQAPPYLERILQKISKPYLIKGGSTDWFLPECLPLVKEIVEVYEKYKNRDQRGRIIEHPESGAE